MKTKIIIVLGVVSLLFLLGGVYLISVIDANASRFEKLITSHQVELLREHLLLNIREVQADLYSQGIQHAESIDAAAMHVREMENSIDTCFNCHHNANVMEELRELQKQIDHYGRAVSSVLTLKSQARRFETEQEEARNISNTLIGKINIMIGMTTLRLNNRTENALREVHQTRIFLILLVAVGPLLIAVLAITVIRGVTGPIQVLLDATRRLKAGDLDFRIEGLRDEFGELAVGFNAMAGSLKEQLRKMEDSEKRYRLLFETATDAIFILDAEGGQAGRIVEVNPAAAVMHDYTIEELLGMHIASLDSPEFAAGAPERIRQILNGEKLKVETEHRKKDGTMFPIEISATLLQLGGHKYILAIDRDITVRKEAEEKMQRVEQLKMVGELAAGLAHEIKNPLSGIKVSIEVLSNEPYMPEEDRSVLVKVIDEIRRIESLIQGLLSFARPPRPRFVETDVNEVLAGVSGLVLQSQYRTPESSRTIAVVKDFDNRLPLITADPMQLKQVFMNLILNAVDAMHEGGTLTMKTQFDAAAQVVRVEISDTGKGISPAVMDKIFHPFFTTKPKGTGLGLAISKRLIEDHGGRIRIEKNASGGVTFKISLMATHPEREHTV
jgi:two-component system, NtrC family, sensor histidine kinase AtoS